MKKNFTFCLVLTTFKKQVDKVNLVKLKINATFTFFSPESLSKMQLWEPKHHTKGADQRKLRHAGISA